MRGYEGLRLPTVAASSCCRLLTVLFSVIILGGRHVGASHFRGGWIKYEVDTDSRTVTYKVTTAWRATYSNPRFDFLYGDGNSIRINAFDTWNSAIPIADVYSSNTWRMTEATLTYTYDGRYSNTLIEVGFSDCCRVPAVNLASSGTLPPFRVFTGFMLVAGATSPSISIPAILQTPRNTLYEMDIVAVAGGGATLNPPCELVLGPDSGIGQLPTIGSGTAQKQANVAPSPCRLQWNTWGANIGDLYAIQVRYRTPGEQSYMSVDFMMEIVADPPDCQLDNTGSNHSNGQYTTSVGGTVEFGVNVDDPAHSFVELSTLPSMLHPGMGFSPGAGVPTTVPAAYSFSYTAPASDAGLTYAFNTMFENDDGVRCIMSISISVVLPSPPPPPPPPPPPLPLRCAGLNMHAP